MVSLFNGVLLVAIGLVLYSVFSRWWLRLERVNLIRKIQDKHQSKVITMIHRQEKIGLGNLVMKTINIEEAESILRALETIPPQDPIDFIIHTPGGMVLAASQIAKAITRRRGPVRVIIPHYAMSGGTLIALAADKIIMSRNAVLGPLDPQVGQMSAPALLELLGTKNINNVDDSTIIKGYAAKRSLQQLEQTIRQIMSKNYSAETAARISRVLTEGRWTHDFPISFEQAQMLGLNVSDQIDSDMFELLSLYEQPVKKAESVTYLD